MSCSLVFLSLSIIYIYMYTYENLCIHDVYCIVLFHTLHTLYPPINPWRVPRLWRNPSRNCSGFTRSKSIAGTRKHLYVQVFVWPNSLPSRLVIGVGRGATIVEWEEKNHSRRMWKRIHQSQWHIIGINFNGHFCPSTQVVTTLLSF